MENGRGAAETRPADDLRELVKVVAITSRRRFAVGGRDHRVPDDASAGGGSRQALVDELTRRLYQRCVRQIPEDVAPPLPPDAEAAVRHRRAFDRASDGGSTWDPDWRVRRIGGGGEVLVEKDGVVYAAARAAVRAQGSDLAAGSACRVEIPARQAGLLAGYYLVHGRADRAPAAERRHVTRLYWHLGARHAAAWVAAAVGELNRRQVPFTLKVLAEPRLYRRADAGVLYLEPGHETGAWPVVERLVASFGDELRSEVPLLTERLAPGLGRAEGPPDGTSFCRERCFLIARALVEVFEGEGRLTTPAALAATGRAFRRAGLDPERPHLAPGSGARPRWRTITPPAAGSGAPGGGFLGAAGRIGDRLCAAAFWHEGRCNWTGRSPAEGRGGRIVATVSALEADLYGGTAGVGLFLAELFGQTGEPEHRRAARGALRQAATALAGGGDRYPPLAFYAGRLGVSWAARRAARLLDDGELAGHGEELLRRSLAAAGGRHLLDLVGGNAGAILGLLSIHRDGGDRGCLQTALELGEEILAAARRDDGVVSWSNRRASGIAADRPPLTGLSHGAAGLGLALLELAVESGRTEFATAAAGAFAYEDSRYDAERRNWPDFRRPGADGPAFQVAWCHGAPGIALARLRAASAAGVPAGRHATAARAGLATTRHALAARLRYDDADATLCHGLGGMIETLHIGGQVLGEARLRQEAETSMDRLVRRHAESGDWPSGLPSRGRSPALFVGEAGIGHLLLRLARPTEIRSVLLPVEMKGGRDA